jgi:hypothetical protein
MRYRLPMRFDLIRFKFEHMWGKAIDGEILLAGNIPITFHMQCSEALETFLLIHDSFRAEHRYRITSHKFDYKGV